MLEQMRTAAPTCFEISAASPKDWQSKWWGKLTKTSPARFSSDSKSLLRVCIPSKRKTSLIFEVWDILRRQPARPVLEHAGIPFPFHLRSSLFQFGEPCYENPEKLVPTSDILPLQGKYATQKRFAYPCSGRSLNSVKHWMMNKPHKLMKNADDKMDQRNHQDFHSRVLYSLDMQTDLHNEVGDSSLVFVLYKNGQWPNSRDRNIGQNKSPMRLTSLAAPIFTQPT